MNIGYVKLDKLNTLEKMYRKLFKIIRVVNNYYYIPALNEKIINKLIEKLKAIHLNDSKNPLSSHKDRHECIGEGHIGIEAFERIINHPQLRNLPFYLETPNELEGYKKEIEILRNLYKD